MSSCLSFNAETNAKKQTRLVSLDSFLVHLRPPPALVCAHAAAAPGPAARLPHAREALRAVPCGGRGLDHGAKDLETESVVCCCGGWREGVR